MNKELYAVKMSTPFGTYTMATYENEATAKEYAEALKANRKHAYVEKVDGIYNGPFKLA